MRCSKLVMCALSSSQALDEALVRSVQCSKQARKALARGVVPVAWLASRLTSGVRVIDASWYLPAAKRQPKADFAKQRIPGARFFDLDSTDDASGLPHQLPSAAFFGRTMASLGVAQSDEIVCYDTAGIFSAPRLWWMLRAYGYDGARVLDGGLPAWIGAGQPTETSPPPEPASDADAPTPTLNSDLYATMTDVRANLEARDAFTLIDARPAGRFAGRDPEPRAGLRLGHVPGSKSVPFSLLVDKETGTLHPPDVLRSVFTSAGVDINAPTSIVTSCGSGVTACVVSLALASLGRDDVATYDGSWAEWGAHDTVPVDTSRE